VLPVEQATFKIEESSSSSSSIQGNLQPPLLVGLSLKR